MSCPEAGTGHEHGGEVVSCGFLVARCDLSEVFELVEEPLDEVTLPVDRGIDRALHLAVSLGRNVAAPAMRRVQLEHRAGVVARVGHHVAGGGMGGQQRRNRRLVRGLPGRQRDRQRQPAVVGHRVDLGAQSATRTAKGVIRPPF